jgi:hypothetical protein
MGNASFTACVSLTVWLALASGCSVGSGIQPAQHDIDEPFVDGTTTEHALGEDASTSADAGTLPSLLPPETLSNEIIAALLTTRAYRGAGFRRANKRVFPSTVAPGKSIDMWVSEAAFQDMQRISPDRSGSHAQVPTGTIIVRDVYDGDELKTITVMVKLEDGSFPLGGDFWYGITDPDGTFRRSDQGLPLAGLLANCGTCHLRRSQDAFLFGTPDGFHP